MIDYKILHEVNKLFLEMNEKNMLIQKEDIEKFISFLHKEFDSEKKIIVASFYWNDEKLINLFGDKTIIINKELPELSNFRSETLDANFQTETDNFKTKYSRFITLVNIYQETSFPPMWLYPQDSSSTDSFFNCIKKYKNSLQDTDAFKSRIDNDVEQFKDDLLSIIFKVYNIGGYAETDLNIFYYPCYLGDKIFFDSLFVFKISRDMETLYSLERIVSIFIVNLHLSIRLYFSRVESIKNAISAIMSRNMSHNIGSHVIADMVSKGVNVGEGDLNSFFRYLQNRMDFIAQITTEFPEWSYPAYFNKEIMRIFYESYILIDRIGVSEGLGAYQWPKNWGEGDMRGKIIVRTCTTQWENGKVKKDTVDWGINEYHMGELENDLQLAIPGGIVGYHAFYIILENIIRNSAKHDYASRMKERLNLNNDIIDELILIKHENIKECSFWIVLKDDANKRIKDKTDIEKKIKSCRALIIESTCLTVEKEPNSSKYDFICEKDKDNVEIKLIDDKVPSLVIPRGDRFFIACIANSHTDNCHFNIKKENSEICLVVDKDYWQEKKPYYQVLTEKEYNQLKDIYGLVKNEIPPGTGSPFDIEVEQSFWKKRYDSIINFLQRGPLRINIRIDDMVDKDYVWVTIWDNMRHEPSIPFDKNNDVNNEVSGNISEDEMKKRVLSIPSVNLFGYMNDRLRQSFIEETGELKRENWGLAELKICAGFLQNRKIEEIGASGQEIIQYGMDCFNIESKSKFIIDEADNQNQGYPRMLIKALPVDKTGQLFKNSDNEVDKNNILKTGDFYFLGFRFWMKKPKTVALHGFEYKGKKE